ncbi:DUF3847 domain-containing protein [Ruminococcus sp. M6(2020)]|uniref:DUF3847 domain-containing protein n=1 Tax=Ruminococcus difficilis TaxID=2763069 RepID=A0A935C1G2_9FIRM|nr:DUF3847 domain-containing protein [Ruminococcus difficilis]
MRLTQNPKESDNLKTKTKALKKQCETTEQKLEQEQHKLTRLQNRASYLKKAQRKQRNKRLILKGVAVETVMPDTEYLSQEDFYSLVEQIYQLDSVQELVEKVTEKYRIIEDGD